MRIPLLIGGATTSRQHTAVKIAPAYSDGRRARARRLARRRRGGAAARPRRSATSSCRRCGRTRSTLREQHATRRERPLRTLAEAARAPPRASSGAPRTCPIPEFTGRRELRDMPLAEIVPFIDWTFFFHAWEVRGKFPEVLDHPRHGAAARDLYANARAMLDELVAGGALTRQRASTASGPPTPTATTSCSTPTRRAPPSSPASRCCASSASRPTSKPQYCARRLRGAARVGAARPRGRLRRDGRDRRRRDRRRLRGRARRLLGDHGQGARRPPRRGLRRDAPRPRAARVGLRQATSPQQRGPDRGGVPGHPAGLRLPGLPRPPAQAPPLRAARRRRGRHDPDRDRWPCCRRPR